MKLKEGDYIYKLRFGVAESRDKVGRIVDNIAIGQTGQAYLINYDPDTLSVKPGYTANKYFGCTYIKSNLYNIDQFEKDISTRIIRNYDYRKLTLQQLDIINKLLKKFETE